MFLQAHIARGRTYIITHYRTRGDGRQGRNKVWNNHRGIGRTCSLHVALIVLFLLSLLVCVCEIFCQFRLSCLLSLLGTHLTSPRTPTTLLTQTHTGTVTHTQTDVRRVTMWMKHSSTDVCVCARAARVWDWGRPLWLLQSRRRDPARWVFAKRKDHTNKHAGKRNRHGEQTRTNKSSFCKSDIDRNIMPVSSFTLSQTISPVPRLHGALHTP